VENLNPEDYEPLNASDYEPINIADDTLNPDDYEVLNEDDYEEAEEYENPTAAPSYNIGRGLIERGNELVVNTLEGGQAIVDFAEEKFGATNTQMFQKMADWSKGTMGYDPTHTTETVKEAYKRGGLLDIDTIQEGLNFAAEQGIKSIPDMGAMVTQLPLYIFSRTKEMADVRAQNEGRKEGELSDMSKSAPFVVASVWLDRLGLKGMTTDVIEDIGKEILKKGWNEGTKVILKAVGKGTVKEATTEALQEGVIEYTGETLGTDKEIVPSEMVERGGFGALAGGVAGGTVSGAVATGQQALQAVGKSPEEELRIEEENKRFLDAISKIEEKMPDATQEEKEDIAQRVVGKSKDSINEVVLSKMGEVKEQEAIEEPIKITEPIAEEEEELKADDYEEVPKIISEAELNELQELQEKEDKTGEELERMWELEDVVGIKKPEIEKIEIVEPKDEEIKPEKYTEAEQAKIDKFNKEYKEKQEQRTPQEKARSEAQEEASKQYANAKEEYEAKHKGNFVEHGTSKYFIKEDGTVEHHGKKGIKEVPDGKYKATILKKFASEEDISKPNVAHKVNFGTKTLEYLLKINKPIGINSDGNIVAVMKDGKKVLIDPEKKIALIRRSKYPLTENKVFKVVAPYTEVKAVEEKPKETIKERVHRRAEEIKKEKPTHRTRFIDEEKAKKEKEEEKTPTVLNELENDISTEEATRSRQGISHVPEQRGRQIIESYIQGMKDDYNSLSEYAKTPEQKELLDDMFADYRKRYVKLKRDQLAKDSRTMSTMITGAANFPVRSNQKKMDSAQKALDTLVNYSEKAYSKMKNKLTGKEAIKGTDENAVEKLQEKLNILESNQEEMKNANKILKSKKLSDDIKKEELKKLGFTDENIKDIQTPDYAGKVGFASFSLNNNNAKIKATKARIADIVKMKELAKAPKEAPIKFDGGELTQDYTDQRIRFIFDGKPDAETIAMLKKRGFRWSSKNGAWQTQLTQNGQLRAKQILSELKAKEVDYIKEFEKQYTQTGSQVVSDVKYSGYKANFGTYKNNKTGEEVMILISDIEAGKFDKVMPIAKTAKLTDKSPFPSDEGRVSQQDKDAALKEYKEGKPARKISDLEMQKKEAKEPKVGGSEAEAAQAVKNLYKKKYEPLSEVKTLSKEDIAEQDKEYRQAKYSKAEWDRAYEVLEIKEKKKELTQNSLALEGTQNKLFEAKQETELITPSWAKPIVSNTTRYEDIVKAVTDAKNGEVSELAERAILQMEKSALLTVGEVKDEGMTLFANPVHAIYKFFFLDITAEITNAKNSFDAFLYKNITSKMEGTSFDGWVRKHGGSNNGLGLLTRGQEKIFVKYYRRLQSALARTELSAQNQRDLISSARGDIAEELFNQGAIRYLENPAIRERVKEQFPEFARVMDKVRENIDKISEDAMNRGLLLPSQYAKWKDKYLSRIYLIEASVKGIDISRGIKQYEIKKGRKIESIVDYLEEFPEEASRLNVVLSPEIMVKQTIGKTLSNIGIDDFFRGVIEQGGLVDESQLVIMENQINNLPTSFSPDYAKNAIIPYLEDMRNRTDIEAEIDELTDVIDGIKAQMENARYNIDIVSTEDKASIPKDKRYGVLSGLMVTADVASLVKSTFKIAHTPEMLADRLDKAGSTFLTLFKFMKVPANIFAYPRNYMSNYFQWSLSGADVNPIAFADATLRATWSIIKKDRWYDMAKEHGMFGHNMTDEELNNYIAQIETDARSKLVKKGAQWMKAIGGAYGWIDDMVKVARMRYAVEKQGMTPQEAVNLAQETHFDYGLTYDLIRAMRSPDLTRGVIIKLLGNLFPTFTQKVIGFMYNTAISKPATTTLILGSLYALTSSFDDDNEDKIGKEAYRKLKKSFPDWVKYNPFVIAQVEKQKGTVMVTFTDVSYIVPFGVLTVAGNHFIQGELGKTLDALGLGGNPLQSLRDVSSNVDNFTGSQIYYEYDKLEMTKDLLVYAGKTIAPGTITKLINLYDSKHPIAGRVIGINKYVYDARELKMSHSYKARQAVLDASKRSRKYVRKILQAKKDYEKGKISKEDYNKVNQKNREEIRRWATIGINAFKKEI